MGRYIAVGIFYMNFMFLDPKVWTICQKVRSLTVVFLDIRIRNYVLRHLYN